MYLTNNGANGFGSWTYDLEPTYAVFHHLTYYHWKKYFILLTRPTHSYFGKIYDLHMHIHNISMYSGKGPCVWQCCGK